MTNEPYPCRYAFVRFTPSIDDGEFANIGVVLICAPLVYFDFRLSSPAEQARIGHFFPHLDPEILRRAAIGFGEELTRIKAGIARQGEIDRTFNELTRKRNGLVTVDTPRLLITSGPKESLERLFDYYVAKKQAVY